MEANGDSPNGNAAASTPRPGIAVEATKLISKKRQPKQIPLDVLVKAVEPLVTLWIAHDKEKRKNDFEFKTKAMHAEMERSRHLTWVALAVGVAVLGLATYLVGKGRDELGIQLITLIAGIVTAAFGGYGYAVSQKRPEKDESLF